MEHYLGVAREEGARTKRSVPSKQSGHRSKSADEFVG
jgi:hypothetical protein